ncbi:type IV pilus biogenesis/stability protein PilW [Candidatus Endoriftia persephone]|jgi:type IV pilus assembly protein PilF|nr:type IV pilus biogenesis/stability protein PilW [Candidatus Endoriftia persephone]EGV51577.1 putative type IV pilus biogenesis protein PilF [endosymbiont of Riftia pachyptila (vent Ph05)]USF86774.1 type IV pilus biogenesis/stability protein PilW [Candidatus Endoriftia persephone]
MKQRFWLTRLAVVSLAVLLSACASQGEFRPEGGATGNLGDQNRKSPADVYVEMGIVYMREGQLGIALKKLKRGLELDPKSAEAHNVIALLYERLGEVGLADQHYTEALVIQPQNPYIHNARGGFFCKRGQYDLADKQFQLALENPLYPTPWIALTNAGLCAERSGDKLAAERYYRRALGANDRFFLALYQMAGMMLEQENHLAARDYIERYHQQVAATAGSLWMGIQIETALGDEEKAAKYKRLLRGKFPDAPEIQLLNQIER